MQKNNKIDKTYLWSFTCLSCRKSFKRPGANVGERKCPHCGDVAINLGRNFKPPKRSDDAQWEKVKFLIAKGFAFHKVYDSDNRLVQYPKTLQEAKEFVEKYKDKAWKQYSL